MIEPKVHRNGQQEAMSDQRGLAQLTSTLEALTQGQTAQQQRDTQIQSHLALVTQQCTTQAQDLARLRTWGKRLVLAVGGLAGLVLALGAAVGWQMTHRPELGYVRALGALDATLGQTWGSMPKAAQEALSATYGRLGLVPPGKR